MSKVSKKKCGCKRKCYKGFGSLSVAVRRVLRVCLLFWALAKPMQDLMLWSLAGGWALSELKLTEVVREAEAEAGSA